jgi:hypothetical protein|tara:strand:- start:553 stop:690 length:138 start_codon:yes stop_codon:yes gene_type:complete
MRIIKSEINQLTEMPSRRAASNSSVTEEKEVRSIYWIIYWAVAIK